LIQSNTRFSTSVSFMIHHPCRELRRIMHSQLDTVIKATPPFDISIAIQIYQGRGNGIQVQIVVFHNLCGWRFGPELPIVVNNEVNYTPLNIGKVRHNKTPCL
jgi:hypothetical protein